MSTSVTLRGARTVVRRWGSSGPTAVVAHSAGLDGRSAQWFGEALEERGAQVVAIDLRGHGGSSAEPAETSLSEIARDLAALPEALALERPHLVGTSLGGAVGSLAVAACPGAYESLTIVCSPDRGHPAFAERATQAEARGMAAVVAATQERWFTARQLADADERVRLARSSVGGMSIEHWVALWRDFARFGGHPDLRGSVRVRCVAGELDASTPPDVMERVAQAVGAPLTVIEGAPHQALMTHAEELARLWLAAVD